MNMWNIMINRFRVSPAATARSLLARLDTHKKLSASEESRVLYALKHCGVPNAADRIIADLGRGTLKELLKNI